jgi:hypothetical protein
MNRNFLAAFSLCLLAASIAGCSHNNAKDRDAVVAAIQKHLVSDSGINMSVMEMTVNNVNITGDQAQADAVFHLKQGGTPMNMNITYQLERHSGDWVVLSDKPSGGGQFSHPPTNQNSGAASPDSAEPPPDAADYLQNHAPPAKQ